MAKIKVKEQEAYLKKLIEYGDSIQTDKGLVDEILCEHLNNVPHKKLYKFRICSNQNFKTLEENCIWMPPANTFKDTFDGTINIDLKANAPKIEEWLHSDLLSLYFNFIKDFFAAKGLELSFTFEDFQEFNERCTTPSGDILLDQEYEFMKKFSSLEDVDEYDVHIKQMRTLRKQLGDKLTADLAPLEQHFREDINRLRSHLRDTMLTYCMTERFDNNNLWESYAEDYKGFCIEYCFENFQNKSFDEYKNLIYLLPMIYRRKIPYFDIVPFIDGAMRNYILHEEGFEHDPCILSALNMQMFYKNKDYEHEHEWRFSIQNTSNNKQSFPFVNAIYVGKDIKPHNLRRLINIAKKLNVPVYRQEFNRSKNGYDYNLVKEHAK